MTAVLWTVCTLVQCMCALLFSHSSPGFYAKLCFLTKCGLPNPTFPHFMPFSFISAFHLPVFCLFSIWLKWFNFFCWGVSWEFTITALCSYCCCSGMHWMISLTCVILPAMGCGAVKSFGCSICWLVTRSLMMLSGRLSKVCHSQYSCALLMSIVQICFYVFFTFLQ